MDRFGTFDMNNLRWDSFAMPLSSSIQTHVFNVYTQLTQMLLISSIACYLQITSTSYLINFLSSWSTLGMFGCMIAFWLTDEHRSHTNARLLLYGFALFKGFSLAPLIDLAIDVDPTIVLSALVSCGLLFGSLSLAVLYSPRPSQIYVTGLLLSSISTYFWLTLFNFFIGSEFLFTLELWLGLGMFSLYVIYDTQMMISKAQNGSKAYLSHALELYIDFIAMFVRILVLLLKKEDEKEEKKKKRK